MKGFYRGKFSSIPFFGKGLRKLPNQDKYICRIHDVNAGVLMIELQGGGHQLKSIQVEAGQGGYG